MIVSLPHLIKQSIQKYFEMIHESNTLTIKELPLRKKMVIDDNHPVKKIQKDKLFASEIEHLEDMSAVYGSAVPMMIRYERELLGQPERLPGLRSSLLSLECHMNRLNRIDFEDVMNRGTLFKRATSIHDYI